MKDFFFPLYRDRLTTTPILSERQLTFVKYTKIMAVPHKYYYTEFGVFKANLPCHFD